MSDQQEPVRADHDAAVQSARQGDRAALQLLLLRNYSNLLGQLGQQLTADDRRRFDAEDVLQQAYARAFRSIAQFRGETEAEFRSWVGQIGKHTLFDLRRRYSRAKRSGVHRRVSLTPADQGRELPLVDSTSRSPSAAAITREQSRAVRDALMRLPADERELIQLRYFSQHSHAEVASRLRTTVKQVRSRCHRSLSRLRSVLGKHASSADR